MQVETHIDRVSEDLDGFCQIMDLCPPSLELNGDLSHYIYRGISRGSSLARVLSRVRAHTRDTVPPRAHRVGTTTTVAHSPRHPHRSHLPMHDSTRAAQRKSPCAREISVHRLPLSYLHMMYLRACLQCACRWGICTSACAGNTET
jgi:hypothetical protein